MLGAIGVHYFVVPALDGPISGGTRYNAGLIAALERSGISVRVLDVDRARADLVAANAGWYWVDSLHLDAVERLSTLRSERELEERTHPIGLVAHYLPSLVTRGGDVARAELDAAERGALDRADAFLVPSLFMRNTLARLGGNERRVIVVEPGCSVRALPRPAEVDGVRAVVIGNLTRGKGQLELLRALRDEIRETDNLELTLIGAASELKYAAACQELVAETPALCRRVRFAGGLAPDEVLRRLAVSNLMLSASVMESYAMALAEVRARGIPILARDTGNVSAHVTADAGGQLLSNVQELARACVTLCRNPDEHRARAARAHRAATSTVARSWDDAARSFLDGLLRLAPRSIALSIAALIALWPGSLHAQSQPLPPPPPPPPEASVPNTAPGALPPQPPTPSKGPSPPSTATSPAPVRLQLAEHLLPVTIFATQMGRPHSALVRPKRRPACRSGRVSLSGVLEFQRRRADAVLGVRRRAAQRLPGVCAERSFFRRVRDRGVRLRSRRPR